MQFSINNFAADMLEKKVIPEADRYGINVIRMKNGATLIDMGIDAKGGWMAGKAFTDTCLGGLGTLRYTTMMVNRFVVPVAAVYADRPALAELSSHDACFFTQYRGVRVSLSGPFRAIAGDSYAAVIDYKDRGAKKAVCHFQTDQMPGEDLPAMIGEAIGFDPKDIYLVAARTGTMTGAVQVCARNIEQVMPTLVDHGFNVNSIVQACGYAPIISVVDNEQIAYGRANDCLIYGQETNLYLDCEDGEIERFLPILPFSKNEDVFGIPFFDLFAKCDNTWTKVPRNWDAPSKINFYNIRTGHAFTTGRIHYGVLESSLLGRPVQA